MNDVKDVYAAYTTNNKVRFNSSSGGLFTEIGKSVLNLNGVVYGVAMSQDCYSASFVRVESLEKIDAIQGSKYIQANLGDTFKTVKIDLDNGKLVLFAGTGCQVNGLKAFLQKSYVNLICLDVVCHGVPSQKLWKEYAQWREKKNGKLYSVEFRSKEASWTDFGMKENSMFIPKDDDPYMRFFLDNYSLRPSCYNCRAKWYKQADITIADFWGIKDVVPQMFDGKGTSLVIVRSIKGQKLFDSLTDSITKKEVPYEEGVAGNTPEYISVFKPEHRNEFYLDMNKMHFSQLNRAYNVRLSTKYKAKQFIKKILKIDRGGDK